MNIDHVRQQITEIIHSPVDRITKAQRIAETIRAAGNYRWVGIYDVNDEEIVVIAWSGIGALAYPRFPVTQGLSSQAVVSRSTVVSNDVTKDPRYLTAFGNTQSEIIVPVIERRSERVLGTLDVESEQKGAFTAEDQAELEACARTLLGLWQ
ncbi:MAG: GAF domain-containing protein [Sinobacteraceae bacterium]|nr:GAF domain-containing protein [Nevskiaceae bacterium]